MKTYKAVEQTKWNDRMMPTASCVLVMRASDLLFLAVSRKNDPNAFGLPGGSVEIGETPAQAATRELKEETGLTLDKSNLIFVDDDGEYLTYTFVGTVSGDIRTNEEGVVKWVNKNTLIAGPFGYYNKKLFDHLGI